MGLVKGIAFLNIRSFVTDHRDRAGDRPDHRSEHAGARDRRGARPPRGEPFTLSGIKQVRDDPCCDLWADTSTLHTSILRGHMPIAAIEAAEVVAAGVLYILPRDFLKQLTTLSVDARTARGRGAALTRFGKFFLRSLWEVYAERAA